MIYDNWNQNITIRTVFLKNFNYFKENILIDSS